MEDTPYGKCGISTDAEYKIELYMNTSLNRAMSSMELVRKHNIPGYVSCVNTAWERKEDDRKCLDFLAGLSGEYKNDGYMCFLKMLGACKNADL